MYRTTMPPPLVRFVSRIAQRSIVKQTASVTPTTRQTHIRDRFSGGGGIFLIIILKIHYCIFITYFTVQNIIKQCTLTIQ